MRQFGVRDLGEVERGGIVDWRQLAEIAKLVEHRSESGFAFCFQSGSDGAAESELKTVERKRSAFVADLVGGRNRERKVLDGIFEGADGDHHGRKVFPPPGIWENGLEDLSDGRFHARRRGTI